GHDPVALLDALIQVVARIVVVVVAAPWAAAETPWPTAETAEAAEWIEGKRRLRIALACVVWKQSPELIGDLSRIRVAEMKNADFGKILSAHVDGTDDLRHLADVGLGIGDDDGVSRFIGGDAGVYRKQRGQILQQLPDLDEPHGNDLSHDPIRPRDPFRIGFTYDWNILGLGFIPFDNGEGAAVMNRRQFVLIEHTVEQVERLVPGQRVVAPDIHSAANGRSRLHI